jgi:hypothetical protein
MLVRTAYHIVERFEALRHFLHTPTRIVANCRRVGARRQHRTAVVEGDVGQLRLPRCGCSGASGGDCSALHFAMRHEPRQRIVEAAKM